MNIISDLLKTLPYAALGAAPGLIFYVKDPTNQAITLMCLGAFIIGTLSHPSVSLANVFSGFMGTVVRYNTPIRRKAVACSNPVEGPIDNSEELIRQILQDAEDHGIDDLLPEPKQIALISYAEGAADFDALDDFLSELSDADRFTLQTGYIRMNAEKIVAAYADWLKDGHIDRLKELVRDREGYNLDSLCRLMMPDVKPSETPDAELNRPV